MTTRHSYRSAQEYPYDLGTHRRPITTTHPDAQLWFDRGLTWLYGFNLEEAAECFQHALEADAQCPMAAWGLAYALGPHYNFPWLTLSEAARALAVSKTHAAAQRARQNAQARPGITAVELALVGAIQARYPRDVLPAKEDDFAEWNRGYADAMQDVYEKFPDDLDVATLYADAMINLTPWKLWDVNTGEPGKGARTLRTQSVLETALAQSGGNKHCGLLHIYIHLMEMSAEPERAVPVANNLRNLVPDCGHLQHMASHIDVLVGSFDLATQSNHDAVAVDKPYLARNGMGVYTIYALHNISSLVYAAMMAGASQSALQGCDRMEEVLTESFLRIPEPNMANYSEAFLSNRAHVLIRFGRWHDILRLPLPTDPVLYCVTTATLHYAKGIAYAALGEISKAEEQRALHHAALTRVAEERLHFPNKSRDVLAVGRAMLDGELEYRKGNFRTAFEHLEKAVELDCGLLYSEPPGWMVPACHAAAALLLEQGHVRRAAELYAENLGLTFEGKQPTTPRPRMQVKNMWALQGYLECLQRLGKVEEAKKIEEDLARANRGADVKITSSCFCRLNGQGAGAKISQSCHM